VAIFGCTTTLALSAAHLCAETILPTGLAPGSVYEIAFVTSDGTTKSSPDITDYNNFVTAEANEDSVLSALGVAWHVIASTEAVDANVNAPNDGTIPVYNTAGQLVSDIDTPLYSGAIINPIAYDQYGDWLDSLVWSGSFATGERTASYDLGAAGTAVWPCQAGRSGDTDQGWLFYAPWDQGSIPVYALSSPITVPVPEPSTLALLGIAAIGLLGWTWRRRRFS
jgi:hypothetical protein